MLILAIDQSASRTSAAVLEDDDVLASLCRGDMRGRRTGMEEVVRLLRDAGKEIGAVDLFAVGIGPGSYAGLRISLATCVGMAIPGNKPVLGVGSAEAVAENLRRETGIARITVVGDARRQRIWLGHFEADGSGPLEQTVDFRLITAGELAECLGGGGVLVTSDWEKLAPELRRSAHAGTLLIEEARMPAAEIIGRLALRRTGGRLPETGPTPAPIYLHPPVFVEPRQPR